MLTRFDLGRDEFVMFKGALIDHLQRFVDEISRHMPQVADRLRQLEPTIPELCGRANAGERLVGLDGSRARRATGLEPGDWESLRTWFVGSGARRSDADNVRRLATDAMRSLLTDLRRIAAGSDRQQSRYGDLLRLAGWLVSSDDDRAHQLWAATFGLYSARHISFPADPDGDPVRSTTSWWVSPAAEVPVGLRIRGDRKAGGRSGARIDYSAAKRARLVERADQERRGAEAARELASHAGQWREVKLSDGARTVFLTLYSRALSQLGRPLSDRSPARGELRLGEQVLAIEVQRLRGQRSVSDAPRAS